METTDDKLRCYTDSREHLFDELARLDLLVEHRVMRFRRQHARAGNDRLPGLCITEHDVDRLLDTETPEPNEPEHDTPLRQAATYAETIREKTAAALENGVRLPFHHLARIFGLTPFEMDALLICLAPELDVKYEKFYAYLLDDVTQKSASVNLVLELLLPDPSQRIDARACFLDAAPLMHFRLLEFDGNGAAKSLLSRGLRPDPRIVDYLLEQDAPDHDFAGFTEIRRPTGEPIPPAADEPTRRLDRLAQGFMETGTPSRMILYLKGPYGVGKKRAAERFCARLGLPLIIANMTRLPVGDSPADTDVLIRKLFREALLQPAAVYLDHFDRPAAPDSPDPRLPDPILRAAEEFSFITFLAGAPPQLGFITTQRPITDGAYRRKSPVITIELPAPSFQQRKRLWELALNGDGRRVAPGVDIDALAGTFSFTGGQIRDAADEAELTAHLDGRLSETGVTMDDLRQACRGQTNQNLSQNARKITPNYSWPDIVLPPDKLDQLREMCNYVKYRHLVYGDWGFDEKISLGKGLNILFSGGSGTGKTMAAEIIAHELGLDLYKIDLSCVVSKYIGETEKNLTAIFKEAETADCVLFFDEADALFGKRSEVKDSHDRYANIEINHLLQKMEEHEGIVILATNFRRNIDEAFTRRMHFSVDFPFPDEAHRLAIWRRIFPAKTPKGGDIDFEFLAHRFKVSGGGIKNIALNASFLAADNSRKVTMNHLVHAVKREFQKMGKMCTEGDFGEYFHLVKEGGR